MAKLRFTLKLTSPAFIAGVMEGSAEGKKERLIGPYGDGLRVPSLRGIIRFWFRALHGHLDLTSLKSAEDVFMGDAGTIGQGLRLIPQGSSPEQWRPIIFGRKPASDTRSVQQPGSKDMIYLGYGPVQYDKELPGATTNSRDQIRKAIPEGSEFHFLAIGTEEQLNSLKRCLIAIHLFGGMGSRSRRGWGSVALSAASDPILPALQMNESTHDWVARVKEDLLPNNLPDALPRYSAFSDYQVIRLGSKGHDSYRKVLREFYNQFEQTRLWRSSNNKRPQLVIDDHDLEARDAQNGTSDISGLPKRLTFGLPYHPRANNWAIDYKGFANETKIERRASPLFLKVLLGPDGKNYAMSLLLKAHFFGHASAKVGKEAAGNSLPVGNWDAINLFMNNRQWKEI